jgi:hypothetical protein
VESVQLEINLSSIVEAQDIVKEVSSAGGSAYISDEDHGLLPLPVLLVIVAPPGLALLASVINRIVHSWTGRGTLVDARGDGPPRIVEELDLPYGSVVILTRHGDEVHRSDLPDERIGDYLAQAVRALDGGETATAADASAVAATLG